MATRVVGTLSTAAEKYSTHSDPIWRERADFIINAPLPEAGRFEQLWTKRVGEDQFEVCCIPYFVYDLALGDTVETAQQGGRQYVLRRVLNRSGRYVFRVYFERGNHATRDSTVEDLQALGAQVEWSSPSLLAVDARDQMHGQQVAAYLHEQEQAQRLIYETGKTS